MSGRLSPSAKIFAWISKVFMSTPRSSRSLWFFYRLTSLCENLSRISLLLNWWPIIILTFSLCLLLLLLHLLQCFNLIFILILFIFTESCTQSNLLSCLYCPIIYLSCTFLFSKKLKFIIIKNVIISLHHF